MYINNISVNTRHNRPSVLSRTALLTYFINDGVYADPYEISAVTIFQASSNMYPSAIIGTNGQLTPSAYYDVKMNFANATALTTHSSFDASNYAIGSSGIYRIKEGVYAVVLDQSIASAIYNLSGETEIENTVSTTGNYLDVWTIRRVAGSELDTVVNSFSLYQDRFYSVTEPVLFRVATRLVNNHIVAGSKVDLKFTNEFTIENGNIDDSITNLFKESFILNPAIEIYKKNEERNLPSRVTVSSFADTSALCDVTSDNTVIFNFNTQALTSLASFQAGTFGSLTGVYVARIKFTALNQEIYSNYFSFIVA